MSTLDNPFIHRNAITQPEDFFGRAVERDRLASLLTNTQSVALVGPRRIGKSSLAHAIRAHDIPDTRFVFLDCGILPQGDAAEVYADMLEEIRLQLGGTSEAQRGRIDYRQFEYALRDMLHGSRLVLVLDEFELMARNHGLEVSFFSSLRALVARLSIAFVTIAQHSLFDLTYAHTTTLSSPFFNIFATLRLGRMPRSETAELLESLAERGGLGLTPNVVDAAWDFVGGHPLHIQVFGYHLFELLRSGDTPTETDWRVITDATAAALHDHLRYDWEQLSASQQVMLKRLPLSPQFDRVDQRLLEQFGWITVEAGAAHYSSQVIAQFVSHQGIDGWLQAGAVAIDRYRRQSLLNGQPLSLTPTQFDLITYLVENVGRVLPSEEIENTLWPGEYIDDPERLKSVVKGLRRALGDHADNLETSRGIGYLWRTT
jgi:hypothetical protein